MIKYNFEGKEIILKKMQYIDGHTAIQIEYDGKTEMFSTNFSKADCGRDLKENEIWICMTPSVERPIVRGLALDMEEKWCLSCTYDFIRTWNEYFKYKIPERTMEMLESDEIIEYTEPEFEAEED